ncbi:hypothetical protein EXM22_07635 [Oceanispirochaeta crateris]|uniref:DHHA2 domain-containing protein n=1 Tax=Oceanispirochaeta crateris TaxID=2518645 RepID=A0A5C1QMS6_9SPIO|nr:DHH family phosphoesterase [Oceanispirochaeta crateris]QEN07866.1 hypothetical protein EXM22_07635 [Oceanispirochaeta crateris]
MNTGRFKFTENLIIMGNQSADLDSVVSSFSMSAFLTSLNPRIQIFPVIQGHPGDLRLKPEIRALMTHLGIDLKSYHFLSEMEDWPHDAHSIVLMDHNKPDTSCLHHKIAGIVDHHEDQGLYQDLSLREIKKTGSCATLVSTFWKTSGLDLPYSQRILLAAAIGVDTGYLNPEWDKTTVMDYDAYQWLTRAIQEEDQAFIESLITIKNDLSHLTLADHLKRDFKIFPLLEGKGGIASIPLEAQRVFSNGFYSHRAITEFCKLQNLKFLLILHTIDQPFKRELSLYVPPSPEERAIRKQIETALVSLKEPGIRRADMILHKEWQFFSQQDSRVSRKGLTPLLSQELLSQSGPLNC